MNVRLNNPYNHTSVVRNTHMFFGRTYLLRRIYSALASQQNVSLVGLRHMGKSSLLHSLRLPEFQKQEDYDFSRSLFVLLDLREYLHKTCEDFFDEVSKQIILQCRERLELALQGKGGESGFSSLLDQIREQDFYLVLLMDAFDNVTRNPNFDLSFFSFLRSQATLGKVSYVTATIAPLHKVCHTSIEESPFFNIFGHYALEALALDEAHALIAEPASRAGLDFTQREVLHVLDLAGRHPFFIQRVCYMLFEEKCRNRDDEIDKAHLTTIAYADMQPYLGSIWERLTSEEQDSLKNIVLFGDAGAQEMMELSESALLRQFIAEKFDEQRFSLEIEMLEEALDKLKDTSILGTSELQKMRSVSLRMKHPQVTAAEKGILIREVLNEAWERLRGNGYRTDSAHDWHLYNILYYRYFKFHLKNEQIVARMNFTSTRQFFRDRKKAIAALHAVLLEMESAPVGREKRK